MHVSSIHQCIGLPADAERPLPSGLKYKTALVFTAYDDTLGQLQLR